VISVERLITLYCQWRREFFFGYVYMYTYICIQIFLLSEEIDGEICWACSVQGGEDSYDPLSCRSFSTKEPLNTGHFCGK